MSLGGTVNNLQNGSIYSKKQRIYDDFSQPTKIRKVFIILFKIFLIKINYFFFCLE